MKEVTCNKCGKKYGYELVGATYPGCKDKEIAYCPYCGEEGYSTMTSQVIVVTKLEKENDFSKNNEEGKENE